VTYFAFEADFVESLRCIPMQVRFKLDSCGVKLKLAQWSQFTQADCQALVDRPCVTPAEIAAYRAALHQLIHDRTGATPSELPVDPQPPWHDLDHIPDSVLDQARSLNQVIELAQWASLTPLQRFALIKLSRSGHENNNFLPALQEFGLGPDHR
jgi:hypothetical protein